MVKCRRGFVEHDKAETAETRPMSLVLPFTFTPTRALTALKTVSINGPSKTSCTSCLNQLLLTVPNSCFLDLALNPSADEEDEVEDEEVWGCSMAVARERTEAGSVRLAAIVTLTSLFRYE